MAPAQQREGGSLLTRTLGAGADMHTIPLAQHVTEVLDPLVDSKLQAGGMQSTAW